MRVTNKTIENLQHQHNWKTENNQTSNYIKLKNKHYIQWAISSTACLKGMQECPRDGERWVYCRKERTWKLAVVLKLTESHHKKQKESSMCENIENSLQCRAFIPGNRLKSSCLVWVDSPGQVMLHGKKQVFQYFYSVCINLLI